jgi:hypothetical protein
VINVPKVTNFTNVTNVTNITILPILLRGGARTKEVIATLEPKGVSKGIEDWGFLLKFGFQLGFELGVS